MEAVRTTQDVSASDLAWKIDYDIQRCTLCGSCIAACTFGAIEAGVLRLDRREQAGAFPGADRDGLKEHCARPCIRQRGDLAHACSGALPAPPSAAAAPASTPSAAWTPSSWAASPR